MGSPTTAVGLTLNYLEKSKSKVTQIKKSLDLVIKAVELGYRYIYLCVLPNFTPVVHFFWHDVVGESGSNNLSFAWCHMVCYSIFSDHLSIWSHILQFFLIVLKYLECSIWRTFCVIEIIWVKSTEKILLDQSWEVSIRPFDLEKNALSLKMCMCITGTFRSTGMPHRVEQQPTV